MGRHEERPMKVPLLEAAHDKLSKHMPTALAAFGPRRYVPPNGYTNPRYYAAMQCAINQARKEGFKDKAMVNYAAVGYRLAEFGVPTYFVKHGFAAAILATDPPHGMTVADVVWPMPAILFVLPDSLACAFFGRPVPFIALSMLQQGDQRPPTCLAAERLPTLMVKGDGAVLHGVQIFNGGPVDYTMACSRPRLLTELCKDDKIHIPAEEGSLLAEANKPENQIPRDEDVGTINRMTTLAFGLVLAMMARPELADPDQGVERSAKVRNGVTVQDALWHPNFVGRNYKVHRSEPQGGSHLSPKMHWRRGHYRHQHHGKGNELVKLVLIDAVLVNAETEAAS